MTRSVSNSIVEMDRSIISIINQSNKIFMTRSVSNSIVEMDRSIISIINQSNNPYINDISLPAQIIIFTLWIEFLCIVSDIAYYV